MPLRPPTHPTPPSHIYQSSPREQSCPQLGTIVYMVQIVESKIFTKPPQFLWYWIIVANGVKHQWCTAAGLASWCQDGLGFTNVHWSFIIVSTRNSNRNRNININRYINTNRNRYINLKKKYIYIYIETETEAETDTETITEAETEWKK